MCASPSPPPPRYALPSLSTLRPPPNTALQEPVLRILLRRPERVPLYGRPPDVPPHQGTPYGGVLHRQAGGRCGVCGGGGGLTLTSPHAHLTLTPPHLSSPHLTSPHLTSMQPRVKRVGGREAFDLDPGPIPIPQVWRLSSVDLSEIARNSVLQSSFEPFVKAAWLGVSNSPVLPYPTLPYRILPIPSYLIRSYPTL